jgi:MOSC domain-containing protein YiiM
MHAQIVSITYKPKDYPAPQNAFLRVPITSAELLIDYGIVGDSKGGNPKRQLNIMSMETVRELEAEGYKAMPGALGEQIIIDGFDVRNLEAGTQLALGEAIVEVTSLRNGCARFEEYQGKPRATGRIGVMARVVQSGNIQIGDAVKVVEVS